MIKNCIVCNKEFYLRPHRKNTAKYCSNSCKGIAYKERLKGENNPAWHGGSFCSVCEKKISSTANFCIKCLSKIRIKENSPHWKGGKTMNTGYICIYQPNHPFATKNGYVAEHRLVVEKILKRYLQPDEIIHHINQIRNDNHPENLYLFIKKEHDKFESTNIKPKLISNLTKMGDSRES